jgi:hypothetical protein
MPKVSANLVCKVTSHLKSKTHNIALSDVAFGLMGYSSIRPSGRPHLIAMCHVMGHCQWTVRGMSRQKRRKHVHDACFHRFSSVLHTARHRGVVSRRIRRESVPFGRRHGLGLDKLKEIQRERRIERNGVIIRNYNTTSTSNTVPPY